MDILMLLIAYLTQILEINNNFSLTLISGAGDNKFVYNINNIIQNLGSRKCTAMLFLHAFIGSDYTSSFHGAGNLKWFDVCYKTEKYDEIFISDEDFLKIIEFTVDEYGIKGSNTNDLALHRYHSIQDPAIDSFQKLPPSWSSLQLHSMRAT